MLPFSDNQVVLCYEDSSLQEHALRLHSQWDQQWNIPLSLATENLSADFLLMLTKQRLELRDNRADAIGGAVYVDFVEGKAGFRRQHEGRQQALARAIGLKGLQHPHIIDATAGLGRDAFVLASLACEVTLLERSPILAALLQDGLNRARAEAALNAITTNMRIIHTNSIDYLQHAPNVERVHAIYIDPMYPGRKKSALVKKEMRVARALVGDDPDAALLLRHAIRTTVQRVVVKRPNEAPALADLKPHAQIPGKTTRYDIYFPHHFTDQ
ncbi:MAG: class I SAM-dependent methyltransferase [Gammaproteobacteria bacterium]|nr:class I SAM-dependent methyltransferase [Gammaproteobacteria bacterium]